MAVDTALKRYSLVHVSLPFRVKGLPIPDGSIDTADRATIPYYYGGIAFASQTDTYISYISASEWLTFYVQGTETLRLNDNGNFLGNLDVDGTLTVDTISAGVADYDKFLVSDGGEIKFRTGAEVLSDIGGGGLSITGTDNRIVRMDGTSGIQDTGCTIDDSDNVTLAGNLLVSGTGSHAIGTALGNVQFRQSGTFTSDGSSTVVAGHSLASTLVGADGDTTYQVGSVMTANITTQDNSETINDVAQLYLQEPNITKGATDTITNASTLWISSVPSEGVSNYAILVDTGNSQFGGEVYVNHASSTYGAAGLITQRLSASDTIGLGIYNATQKWDFVNIVSGTPDYFGIRDSTNGNMSLRIEAGYTSGSILVLESDGSATFGDALVITDKLTVNSISAGVSDYDKFLVSDGGEVKFRTGAELLSDIGASTLTISGTDNRIVRMDGTSGIQDSGITIADTTDNVSGMGTLGCGAITSTGAVQGSSFTDTIMTIGGGAASALTLNLTSNTLTGTMAQFDTACSNGNFAYAGGAFHDGFSDFVANEHIDWTSTSSNFSTSGTLGCGEVTVSTINAGVADYDKFLVSDGGVIKFRTGAEVLSDIGAGSGLTIGDAISGGTANRILWEGGSNTLTESDQLTYNGSTFYVAGNIGGGTDSPEGKLHIRNGSAGTVTAPTFGTLGVFEASASNGISIIVPDANQGNLFFGTPSDNLGAGVSWSYTSNEMEIRTNNSGSQIVFKTDASTTALTLDSSQAAAFAGNVTIPDSGYIGSTSDTDSIQIEAAGNVLLTQELEVDGHVGLGGVSASADAGVYAFYEEGASSVQMGMNLQLEVSENYSMYAGTLYVQTKTKATTFTCNSANGIDIAAAAVGAGSTLSQYKALMIGNQTLAGTNYAIWTGLGMIRFGDDLGIGRDPAYRLDVYESDVDAVISAETDGAELKAYLRLDDNTTEWRLVSENAFTITNATDSTSPIYINASANNNHAIYIYDDGDIGFSDDIHLKDDMQARFGGTNPSPDAYIEWDTAVLGELLAYVGSGDIHLQAGSGDIVLEPIEANNVVVKEGELTFSGTARIGWTKITANSLTLTTGTSANSVSDLQTAHDGNTYDIAEAASTPGIDMYVEFISVDAFNWVQIIAHYDGSATHSVSIEVYNWSTTSWNTFDSQDGIESTMTDHSFILPDDTNYIGTGGNDGKVRVRFDHTQSGNASHDLYIDVVALYQ